MFIGGAAEHLKRFLLEHRPFSVIFRRLVTKNSV